MSEVITEKLISLCKEHPGVPLLCSVDEEVVTGEYVSYLAQVHDVYYTEYAIYGDRCYTDREELIDDWIYNNCQDYPEDASDEFMESEAKKDTEDLWSEAIVLVVSTFYE